MTRFIATSKQGKNISVKKKQTLENKLSIFIENFSSIRVEYTVNNFAIQLFARVILEQRIELCREISWLWENILTFVLELRGRLQLGISNDRVNLQQTYLIGDTRPKHKTKRIIVKVVFTLQIQGQLECRIRLAKIYFRACACGRRSFQQTCRSYAGKLGGVEANVKGAHWLAQVQTNRIARTAHYKNLTFGRGYQ